MKLKYTELWNPKYHGYNKTGKNPFGHFISIMNDLTLDEFYNLDKSEFIIKNGNNLKKLEIIDEYDFDEYTLSKLMTYRIKLIQRKWRKKYYKIDLIN